MLVGGQTAELIDTKPAIGVRLPVAAAWIVLTTLLVLFLFTGSVLQALRSLLLNPLTLTATLGPMVWIFQDGQLSSVVHFTPAPAGHQHAGAEIADGQRCARRSTLRRLYRRIAVAEI